MFDSAAHAHRILAILEAGDMMNNVDGYRCSNPNTVFGDADITHSPCANATLRRETFYDLTKDGETGLFCIACASHMIERGWSGYSAEDVVVDKGVSAENEDYVQRMERVEAVTNIMGSEAQEPETSDFSTYDKARMVRESSFLLESEGSFYLFDDAATSVQAEEADGLSQDDFWSIFDIRNDVNKHMLEDFEESDSEALSLMQLFDEKEPYALTDMQKREIRLELKRLKLRENKS